MSGMGLMRSNTTVVGTNITIALDGQPPVPVSEVVITGPEIEYVRYERAVMPDPKWTFTDSHGHEHRWASTEREDNVRDAALPTLTKSWVDVPCDGSCGGVCGGEGYSEIVWHCTACGDPVEPGYIPDYLARTSGIPVRKGYAEYTFTVGEVPFPQGDSYRQQEYRAEVAGDITMTGRAWIGATEWRSNAPARIEVHFAPDQP